MTTDVKPIQLTIPTLSTAVRAIPSFLAPGGVQIEIVSFAGSPLEDKLTLSLTDDQANALVDQITAALAHDR